MTVHSSRNNAKAGFLTPAKILSSDDDLLSRVAKKVSVSMSARFSGKDVLNVFVEIFSGLGSDVDTSADASDRKMGG
jgi:dGTPase